MVDGVQEHRGRGRVRLDVVDVVAEPLEADQVLHRLPDDAGDRHPGHHAEQHDFLPGKDVQANCSSISDGDGLSSATTDSKAGTNASRPSRPRDSDGTGRARWDLSLTRTHRGNPPSGSRLSLFRTGDQVQLMRRAPNKAINRVAAASPRTQARTPRPSKRAAAAIATGDRSRRQSRARRG